MNDIYIYIYMLQQRHICLSHNSQQPQDLFKSETVHNKASCVYWFRWRIFWAFFVNCDLINNKSSTVITFGTCAVNVWGQLELKCCLVKVFIAARNLKFSPPKKTSRFCKYVYTKLFLCSDAQNSLVYFSKHFWYISYRINKVEMRFHFINF